MSIVSGSNTLRANSILAGQRVLIVGKLASMSRRDAERLVREHGGRMVELGSESANLIVASDDEADLKRLLSDRELFDDELRARISRDEIEVLHESDLWTRLGLVDSNLGVARLYTAAMLAKLVRVPVTAIRQWHRRGALRATRKVRRLAYFDFEEVRVARKLAQLLHAGCSLSTVNRKLASLSRMLADSPRPLADPAVVVEGRRLYIRRDEGLAEPSGQLLIDFDIARTDATDEPGPVAIPFVPQDALRQVVRDQAGSGHPQSAEELRALAAELEESGQLQQAADVYRAILFTNESAADDHFALAELLYLGGDLSAARERYYVSIELDEDFVEARSNLGCVLAEQGDVALAESAFRGALEYHPDYADAHYHLARLLDRTNRSAEASRHWQLFMNLAPASPWADEARERLAEPTGD
ncbi:MAG TPA: tetratricopeptide repeat protein [Lacipirellulaceae bacterium]|nr:tetratricopeptide repeat protein [Lacipirellulaceae bacterium]